MVAAVPASTQQAFGWSEPVTLAANDEPAFANIASNPSFLVVAWRDFTGCDPFSSCDTAIKARASSDSGNTWSPVQTIARQDYNESLDLAASDTSAVAAWTSGPYGQALTDLRLFRFDGQNWTEATTFESNVDQWRADLLRAGERHNIRFL